jgi:S-adenosylmethionine synthetase
MEKLIEFEDGSYIELIVNDDKEIQVTLQARHLGKEFKITSMSVSLQKDEAIDLQEWLSEAISIILED